MRRIEISGRGIGECVLAGSLVFGLAAAGKTIDHRITAANSFAQFREIENAKGEEKWVAKPYSPGRITNASEYAKLLRPGQERIIMGNQKLETTPEQDNLLEKMVEAQKSDREWTNIFYPAIIDSMGIAILYLMSSFSRREQFK